MSKIDDKYIKALDTFTGSLEQIVETLKAQQKNNTADVVIEFLKTPMDNLVEVVSDLKKITQDGFANLKSQNEIILKKIESIKQQKESGAVEKIEDPKNKNKIVDGIKVIMLIAGGVLALGLAFKIIGKVDFLSVVALSGAILMMSIAFSKIAAIKELTYAKVFVISSVLPIMALGLLASGLILSAFPTIGLMQGISMIIVGATVGIAAYLLITAMSKIDIKKNGNVIKSLPYIMPQIALGLLASGLILSVFPTIGLMQGLSMIIVAATVGVAAYLLITAMSKIDINKNGYIIDELPFILPSIALGLLASGWMLKAFPTIGLMQGLSMIIVAATVGVAAYLLITALSKLDMEKNGELIVTLPFILPLIALGLVLSSVILQAFMPIKNPLSLLLGSLVIGLSVLIFTPTIMLLGKMDLKQIGKGVLAIPMIAGAILATSWIFQLLPTKMTYPDWKWSLSVGLSVAVFALIVTGVGFLATKFKKEFEAGLLGIVAIAAIIAVTDYFISQGDYTKYPDWKWPLGVGLSIGVFGLLSFGIGFLANLNKTAFALGLLSVVALSAVIFISDWILSKGTYDKYPDVEWSKGLGLSLGVFGVAALAIGLIVSTGAGAVVMALGVASILVIAASMLAVDAIFSLGSFTNYPSSEWASGVSKSMALFSSFGVEGNPGILGAIGGVVSGFIKGVGGAMTSATMIPIAMSMVAVDKIFSQGSFTKYPTSEWALGVSSAMAIFSNPDILKNFSEFSGQLKDLPDISALDTTSSSIAKLASSFATLASSIGLVNTNLQGFTGLYKDLSIINDNKFSNLKTSDKATFQIVNQSAEKQVNLLSSGINSSSDNLPNIVDSSVKDSKSLQMNEESEKQKKFYSDISDIKSLLYDIKDSMDQPAQAGSFYK